MLKPKKNEAGQAMIEFLMILPILLSFLWYMIHVSIAINKSQVGQVNARSQLFLKMFNHEAGPVRGEQGKTVRSDYYVGVAGEVVPEGGGKFPAPVETLGVGAKPKKSELANEDPGDAKAGTFRQNVRIRTVFGICTQRKLLPGELILETDFCGDKQQ